MWLLVRDHVGLDVAEGGIRLVLDAVVEGLDDVFLEVVGARMDVRLNTEPGLQSCQHRVETEFEFLL